MTNNTEARAREVLESQMEQQDENLPSSVAREQGLVWLSGWFDLSAVLGEYGNERAAQEREANAAIAEKRAARRVRLYEENGAGINAYKAAEAEEIAAAIRARTALATTEAQTKESAS